MRYVQLTVLWIILFLLPAPGILHGSELTRAFLDGINEYKTGHYAAAVEKFSFVADNGIINPKLFYNLGNAYLKNDELGYAILWYERALRLTPNDPDLKFNLDHARSLVKDINEDKKGLVFQILFFWKHLLSAGSIQWTAIGLSGIFWILLTARLFIREKISGMLCWIVAVLAVGFILTAVYNQYEAKYIKQAVIISKAVSVRSGLAEDATELFILHAGTKVDIKKEYKGFLRIYFSNGKIGWLKNSDAVLI